MLYNIKESLIDNQGLQYICGMLEEPKLNEKGLWHNIRAFDILLNHKKQSSIISVFDWQNGVPCNFKSIKKIENEIIGVEEVENVLRKYNIIK